MSDPQPAPGWYPDPAGAGARWWTGREWGPAQQPLGPMPIVQPPLPAGTSTDTRWAIIQALLPIGSLIAMIPYLLAFRSVFEEQFALMRRMNGSDVLPPAATRELFGSYAGLFGTFALTTAISLLLLAAWVVLAALDVRELRRRGVVQPFHWAWAFLSLVYPIGRAVVVHRRTGGGLRPLWVLIIVYVASVVLMFAAMGIFFGAVFAELPADLPSYSYSTGP